MKKALQPTIERGMTIEIAITKLGVPHNGRLIHFAHPSVGSNTYQEVRKQILSRGMNVPNGDYMASLLHTAYCDNSVKDEPEFKNVRDILSDDNWLLVFNRVLWTEDGVYVVPDLEAVGLSKPLNQNDLEEMLKGSKEVNGLRFNKDKTVRFAEKGSYNLGVHTPESLAKDGFVIASYDFAGAAKLGEVSTKFNDPPQTHGLDVEKGESPELRVSALNERFINGFRLFVSGHIFDDSGDCRGFGVLE